jgi:hypothetical protein
MVLSLAGCDEKVSEAAKSRDVPVMSAIMNCGLPADWQYRGLGGSGGDDGGGYGWEISLGSRSHDQVMRDLSDILKKSVTGCGFVVGGGGESRGNGTLDGFSFCAKAALPRDAC